MTNIISNIHEKKSSFIQKLNQIIDTKIQPQLQEIHNPINILQYASTYVNSIHSHQYILSSKYTHFSI